MLTTSGSGQAHLSVRSFSVGGRCPLLLTATCHCGIGVYPHVRLQQERLLNTRTEIRVISSMRDNGKHVVVVVEHPFPISIGEQIQLPNLTGSRAFYATVTHVAHDPMIHYGDSYHAARNVTAELNPADFDDLYGWLESRKESEGLTHQWENWNVQDWTRQPVG